MALIIPSTSGEIRGAEGGIVYSRNRSGPYIRMRAKPVNPNTPSQILARQRLTNLAIAWSAELTQQQRDAWDVYASNVPSTNKVGLEIFLTGENWFISSNSLLLQAGLARVDDAPTVFERAQSPVLTDPTGSIATQQIDVAFDPAEGWANEDGGALLLYQGLPVNASRKFFGGPFRFLGVTLGDGTTPPTPPATFPAVYPFGAGSQVFVEGVAVRADARTSARVRVGFLPSA